MNEMLIVAGMLNVAVALFALLGLRTPYRYTALSLIGVGASVTAIAFVV